MKLATKILPFAIAFLVLFASIVTANINITVVQHDTDVQSTYQNLKTCSCGGTVDSFRVKNIGDLTAHYSLALEGDEPWFTLGQSTLTLGPGESADVYVFTQAPCDAVATGHYKVYVASEYGRYRAFEKTVQTGVCENIASSVTPESVTVQPCGSANIYLNIANTGTFPDNYDITSDDLSFPASVQLDAGESTTVIGGYTASCSEWGTQTRSVTVVSRANQLKQTHEVLITVPRAYDYTVDLGAINQPVCQEVTSSVPVFVKNTEDRVNSYKIETNGYNQTITVPANTTIITTVPFTPSEPGNQTFSVNVVSANGSIEKHASVSVPVNTCYDMSVTAPETVNACAGELYLPFTITNTGTERQTIALNVLSNATTNIDSLSVDAGSGQEVSKTVGVDIPNVDRSYYVTLATDNGFTKESATTTVKGYSTESCYLVQPSTTHFQIWTDQTILPVVIEGKGIQPGEYNVSYDSDWMQPLEKTVSINPDGQAILHFSINSTGRNTGRYLDRLVLSTHGVNYTNDFEINLREKGFWQHFLDACRWNGEFGVCSVTSSFSLIILLLVVIGVIGIAAGFILYERPIHFPKQTIAFIGVALIIILLAAMYVSVPQIPRSYVRPIAPSNSSNLFYEIGQGQQLTFNLNSFFKDPDNDNLTYTASQAEHLLVRIDGPSAIVKTDKYYAGLQTLVFTANDNRGGLADSDVITVSVVPYKPITFLEYWEYACWFITFLFLLLTVVIALLAVFTLGDSRKKKNARTPAVVLYRRPRTEIVKGDAQMLVERSDLRTPAVSGIQAGVVANQIIVNNGVQEQLFVASVDGTRFHRITCPVVKGMPKEKRLTFSTRDDAIKAGFTPCKTCSSH